MKPADAQSLTKDWTRLSNEHGLEAEHSAIFALGRELTDLIPDNAKPGLAIADNTLAVHAIDNDVLLSVSAGEMSGSAHSYKVVARPLRFDHVNITVKTEIRSGTRQTVRKRLWKFEVGGNGTITIEGSEILDGANSAREQDPDSSEMTARELARGLGWQVPEIAS